MQDITNPYKNTQKTEKKINKYTAHEYFDAEDFAKKRKQHTLPEKK